MPDVNETNQILKGLDEIDAKISTLEQERNVSQKAMQDELKKLGEEQVKLSKALSEIEQQGISAPQDVQHLSLGESFVKSNAYASFDSARSCRFVFSKEEAAASTPSTSTPSTTQAANSISRTTVAAPYLVPGILTLPDAPLNIEALFPHVPISATSIQYVKEGTMTNNAAVVAEGAKKPETTFTQPTLATADVVTVPHWTRITKQLADDSPALVAYINSKMQYGLRAKIDAQLINGKGGTAELPGMLHTGNYTDPSAAIQPSLPTGADLFDFALFLKARMESTNITPSAFILNPADWTALCVIKDKQGRYILGGPQSIASKSMWGVPVITSANVTQGKYLMANFTFAGTIYDREEMTLAMSESDSDNFTQNLITLRVERRLGFAIEQTSAIYGGTWAVPTAASK